jgi:predicted glycosyltransferase
MAMSGRIVSFAWNYRGLGHASRLTAIHSELRDRGWESLFFTEHKHKLLQDYGFEQVIIPDYTHNLVGDDWWGSGGRRRQSLAELLIRESVGSTDVVLHDVVIHRGVYEVAGRLGCPQALIHRIRKDRPDPGPWVAAQVPDIHRLYVIGHPEISARHGKLQVRGTSNVMRKPLDDQSVWSTEDVGARIAISAAGGGHSDAPEFLTEAITGVGRFLAETGTEATICVTTGPFFRGEFAVPSGVAAKVRVTPYIDPRHSLYRGTDFLVAQGGYNTIQEITHHGLRAVVVPGPRDLDDQSIRAHQLAAEDQVQVAVFAADDIASRLADLAKVEPRTGSGRHAPPPGAQEIADDLIEFAGETP